MSSKRERMAWWLAASFPLTCFLAVPMLALAKSGIGDRTSISEDFSKAIELSFKTSLLTILFIVVFGLPLAYVIARWRSRGRILLSTLVDIPVAFPPAAAGIALLLAYGRTGLVPTSFAFTTAAVVIAQSFVACPFFVRAAASAFQAVDRQSEESAQLDGAGALKVFFQILLPQTAPQLISGGIMSWARALGEFGATILFAGNLIGKTQTMPLAIYLGFESDLSQAVMLSIVLLAIAFIAILGVRLLANRDYLATR